MLIVAITEIYKSCQTHIVRFIRALHNPTTYMYIHMHSNKKNAIGYRRDTQDGLTHDTNQTPKEKTSNYTYHTHTHNI